MKTKTYKKFLSLLLAVMLTLSMLPMSVFALGETGEYLGVNAGSEVPESFTNDLWLQYDFKEMKVGDTAKLNPRRVEEAITNAISNDVQMPHFNYEIIKGDSVTIDATDNAHAVVTAVKNGNTVVKVTYDAFDHTAGKHFDAVDPVNTAYVVYSVGGSDSITIRDNIVQKDADKVNITDVVFRSYDTLYFKEGETVPFNLVVSTEGAESLTVKCNGITVQESSESGVYVLPLENRSNIIEMTAQAADGSTRSLFRVLDARKIKINVENVSKPGEKLQAGNTAKISFTGVTMPVYKLATIYNPCSNDWGAKSTNVHYECNGITYVGACTQWDLATKNSFEVTFDSVGTYEFTNGSIYSEWWGSTLGADKITDNPGEPNLNAPINAGEFSFMPDFSITVVKPVESVTISQDSLELKVGKSQTLTATVSPEDATDKSVTWSSDNEEAATVDENGLVTAVGAGVANITVKTVDGEFIDVCKVTVKEPEGYLSAVKFRTSNGFTAPYLELVPEFDAKKYDYTVIVPDNGGTNVYITAVLSSAAPEGSTASVEYFNEYAGANKTVNGITKETRLPYAANPGVVMTVKAGTEEDNQTYIVKVMHSPTVSGISLTDENGKTVNMNETFKVATTEYTATTAADKITVNAAPYNEEYTVTYNGSESGEVELVKGENVVNVVVKNGDGLEKIYTVKITKVDGIFVSFSVNPTDAVVLLKDRFGERLWPDENGRYSIMAGVEYSYLVTRSGYIAEGNSFTSSKNMLISINLEKATENSFKNLSAYWPNFRNGDNHLGINTSKTPYAPEDAELLWAVKYGSGWSAAPGSPIIVDDCIVTYVGSTIKKINKDTGAVLAEGQMVGSSSFSIVPPTYADGMIFVGLSGGRIQAFNAETLESIWVYTDDLGGQPNCPITYKDGYVYAGFWNSEIKGANFACVSVTDEDPNETTEAKEASWTYTRVGGFYWAGAYASDKFVVVGTDDGLSGYNSESASLLVFDRITGELVDSYDGIRGDIRSNVSYDPTSDRVFFSSKGGVLCNAKIDWETGEIKEFNSTVITDSKGNEYAMSTCTPSVYNGRIYIGVSGKSQFGAFTGHAINVYDLNSDGSMTLAYSYDIIGYPQTSAMVTTAYAAEDGYVYIYLPYNYTPGGISVLKDKPGQTEPITTTDAGYSEVFTPVPPLAQYSICSTIADEYGTIYYKNDSCYLMAITSKIESIEVIQKGTLTDEDGSVSGEGFVVVANLKNGMSRDISSEVEFSKEGDAYVVSYTYGFDNANYGLKTLKTCVEGHSYGDDNVCDICGHVNYEVIEGADSTWKKNSTDPVSMTANGTYANFRALRVDGEELDSCDYDVFPYEESTETVAREAEQLTKIVLKASYLDTLGEGEHKVEVVFSDGKAVTTLTIEKVPAPSNVGYRDTTTIVIGGNNNSNSESEYNPNTGAELPLNAVMFAALCAAMLAVVKKR